MDITNMFLHWVIHVLTMVEVCYDIYHLFQAIMIEISFHFVDLAATAVGAVPPLVVPIENLRRVFHMQLLKLLL